MLANLKNHYWKNHWFIYRSLFALWCVLAMWGLTISILYFLEGQNVRGVILLLAHGYFWMMADFSLRVAYARQRYWAARKLFFAQSAANAFAVLAECVSNEAEREQAFRELEDCVDAFCGYYAWWLSDGDTHKLTGMAFAYAQARMGLGYLSGDRLQDSDYLEMSQLLAIIARHKGGVKNEETK